MNDEEAIRIAALDYIEGWYEGSADRMDRALSPHLVKRRIVSEEEIWDVDRKWMVEAAGNGKGRIDDPEKGRKEIVILDRTDSMASLKIVSENFVDYLHMAKPGKRWEIVNALWDYLK